MNKPIKYIAALSLVLGLTSCEKLFVSSKTHLLFEVNGVGTRGAVTDKTALQTAGVFVVNAFLEEDGRRSSDDTNPHYLSDFSYNGTAKVWTGGETDTWRHMVYTNFWCHYPKTLGSGHGTRTINFPTGTISDAAQKSISVRFTMPASAGASQDAALTDDLLFAYSRKQYNDDAVPKDPSVKLTFKHILSALMFTKGSILEDYDIESISLLNLKNEATCSLDASSGTMSISWGSFGSGKVSYTQSITASQLEDGAMTSGDKVFWVIPQEPSATTALRVVFTKGSEKIPIDYILGSSSEWEAQKYYNYSISFNGVTAIASLSSGEINFYNLQNGVWDENPDELEDYNTSTGGGEWGIDQIVGLPALVNQDGSWGDVGAGLTSIPKTNGSWD